MPKLLTTNIVLRHRGEGKHYISPGRPAPISHQLDVAITGLGPRVRSPPAPERPWLEPVTGDRSQSRSLSWPPEPSGA